MTMRPWVSLIRFQDYDDDAYFAELPEAHGVENLPGMFLTGYSSFDGFLYDRDSKQVQFRNLLSPTPVQDNEIICIGVNYRSHVNEAKLPVPEDPVMWYKPRRSLSGPGDVRIPDFIGSHFLDFEGELTIVTSKDARDVVPELAAEYILGYTIGNDLTARALQNPARAGGQYTRAKNFDNSAPIGPLLLNAKAFGSLKDKKLTTKVNGKIVQDSELDLIHEPAKLLSFLSQGVTIPAGTLIMTGTPSGVGWFQEPKSHLKHKDVVEISVTGMGTLVNRVVFDQSPQ